MSAHQFKELFGYGEPKTRTVSCVKRALVLLGKRIEDMLNKFRPHPDSGIFYFKPVRYLIIIGYTVCYPEEDDIAVSRELDRIVQHIYDDALEMSLIPEDVRIYKIAEFGSEIYFLVTQLTFNCVYAAACKQRYIHGTLKDRNMIVLKVTYVQYIIQQALQVIGFAGHIFQIFADFINIGNITLGHFDHIHNLVQRCLYVMRQIYKETVLLIGKRIYTFVCMIDILYVFINCTGDIISTYSYQIPAGVFSLAEFGLIVVYLLVLINTVIDIVRPFVVQVAHNQIQFHGDTGLVLIFRYDHLLNEAVKMTIVINIVKQTRNIV